MGLQPKADLFHKNKNTEVWIVEKTGLYDANTNVGGYDDGSNTSGNPKVSDVANVLAVFTLSDGRILPAVNLKSTLFPNAFTDRPIVVTAAMLGIDYFPDGLTKLSLFYDGYFTVDPFQFFSAEVATQDYITSSVQCCVQKMWTKIHSTKALCSDGNFKIAQESRGMLIGIWNLAGNTFQGIKGCNQVLSADIILKELQASCAQQGTSCCP